MNELAYFVPYYEFYNEAIESSLEMKDDYPKWKEKEGFSFCHYPFVLSTTAKAQVLKLESVIHMRHELQVKIVFCHKYHFILGFIFQSFIHWS